MSAPVFRLKGSGWYETDFKSDKENKRNLAASEKEEPKAEAKADSKPEAKAEPKSESKPAADKPSPVRKGASRAKAKKAAPAKRRSSRR
jgi:hypothetical protein